MKLALNPAREEVITPAISVLLRTYNFAVMKYFINFLIRQKIHFFSWTILIVAESVIIGLATGVFGDLKAYAVHYTLNIILFYLCALWLYPGIFVRGHSWIIKLPVYLSTAFFIYLFASYYFDTVFLKKTSWYGFHPVSIEKKYLFSKLWRSITFMGLAGFYFLFIIYKKENESRKKAEQDHLNDVIKERNLQLQLENAKNSYLKAQINPHLLFNTLSFIYQDILESSPRSAEVVMELSDIMRYSIRSEFREPLISLREELEQVERLISLQKMRFDGEVYVNLQLREEIYEVLFIPLVLLTLTENIFKHGIFQDKNNPANLILEVDEDKLHLTCSNLPKRKASIESLNTGLENIRQRLQITYGSHAIINYGLENGYFEVSITAPASWPNTTSKTG